MEIFKELWLYMKIRKKWWITPIIVFLIFLGFLITFAETSVFGPLIYTLF